MPIARVSVINNLIDLKFKPYERVARQDETERKCWKSSSDNPILGANFAFLYVII